MSRNLHSFNSSVAVVIPTFNRWPHITSAVDSCLEQEHPGVEVVVVDDASSDGSAAKLRKRYGSRIELIKMPVNVEKSRARNEGIRAAGAEFVCMLDSDDMLHSDGISRRMSVFAGDPSFDGVSYGSTCFGPAKCRLDHARYPSGDILHAYVADFGILNNNAFMLRRATMLRDGMYREDLTNMEDRELLIRLTARLPFLYCGAVVQTVRRVDRSARSCFRDLVRQGDAMTSGLRQHPLVMKRLGNHFRRVEYIERHEVSRAEYKLRMYRAFASSADRMLRDFPERVAVDRTFHRRRRIARVLRHLWPGRDHGDA